MEPQEKINGLGVVGSTALVIGAVGSEFLMLRVGRRNPSVWLMVMFAGWVMAPFAALGWCQVAAKRWSQMVRVVLHLTSLLVSIGSLVVYGYIAWGPARPQPAFFFLVLPAASLVFIAGLVVWATRREKGRQMARLDSP